MFIVNNKTEFTADAFILNDKSVVTIIKASFSFNGEGAVGKCTNQKEIQFADEYFGEPGKSSLKYPTDLVSEKNGTDLGLICNAYPPKPGLTEYYVSFEAGELKKILKINNDAFFEKKKLMGFKKLSNKAVENFLPIRYENSFGGSEEIKGKFDSFLKNPVGTGYFYKNQNRIKIPNLTYPGEEIKQPGDTMNPAGFGFIPPFWEPRVNRFLENENQDFKNLKEINNSAPEDQIYKDFLKGGEKISIVNLHPESKKIEFNLPVFNFTTAYIFEDETQKPEPLIDTLIVEPEENLFTMVWRSKTDPEKYNELQQINIYETEE